MGSKILGLFDIRTLKVLKSSAYADGKINEAYEVEKLLETIEYAEDIKDEIDNLYKQGYNYLDIAKIYEEKGNFVNFNDNVFILYIKNLTVIFEHTSYEVKISIWTVELVATIKL